MATPLTLFTAAVGFPALVLLGFKTELTTDETWDEMEEARAEVAELAMELAAELMAELRLLPGTNVLEDDADDSVLVLKTSNVNNEIKGL